jgi:methionyl-tRNA formyltransferase
MTPLRIAVIGRTEMLLEAGRRIAAAGHTVSLVATCKESSHETIRAADFERWAAEIGATFLRGPDLSRTDAFEAIRLARCDVAISMNWVGLLPAAVRDCFPHGIYNTHPGDLPRFKGNACPNWAILMGEDKIGLVVHRMVDTLDAGPIALRAELSCTDMTTIGEVYGWLSLQIPELLLALVTAIAEQRLSLTEQPNNPGLGLRCYPRNPRDGRIDWNADSVTISRLVRASGKPFEGAFTLLDGERLIRVWTARRLETTEPFVAVPGQVLFKRDGDPVIATGKGMLQLTDVSFDASDADAKAAITASMRNRLV